MRRRLQGATTEDRTITGDFRGAAAYGSVWRRVIFNGTRLNGADFRSARFEGCIFNEAEIDQADFSAATFDQCTFRRCEMGQARFLFAVATQVDVVESNLTLAAFSDATLRGVKFDHCDLRWAHLDFVEGRALVFQRCNLQSARIPMGCQFWNSYVDAKTLRRFVAMVARIFPEDEGRRRLEAVAGPETVSAVERLMRIEDVDFEPKG